MVAHYSLSPQSLISMKDTLHVSSFHRYNHKFIWALFHHSVTKYMQIWSNNAVFNDVERRNNNQPWALQRLIKSQIHKCHGPFAQKLWRSEIKFFSLAEYLWINASAHYSCREVWWLFSWIVAPINGSHHFDSLFLDMMCHKMVDCYMDKVYDHSINEIEWSQGIVIIPVYNVKL